MGAPSVAVLRRLTARAWIDVVMAAAIAVVVEIGLRTTKLPRLARALGTPLGDSRTTPTVVTATGGSFFPPRARSQVRATRRVMRHWPFGDTCLRQALVAGQRLRRLEPTLQVGVAKIDGEVRAHAWLEIDGVILDPLKAAGGYQPMLPVGQESSR